MKKYEYKFFTQKSAIGFDFDKKVKNIEEEWNKLGSQGWKFCKEGFGCIVFMREIDDAQDNTEK